MTIYEVLKRDHKKVQELLDQIEKTDGRGASKRALLFEQLKDDLLAHAKAEDAIFYARIRDTKPARKITLEAHEEHRVVERLLDEMARLDATDEVFLAKFKVLKEAVEHHVEEEEGELFQKARKAIDVEEARELGEKMLAAESRRYRSRAAASR